MRKPTSRTGSSNGSHRQNAEVASFRVGDVSPFNPNPRNRDHLGNTHAQHFAYVRAYMGGKGSDEGAYALLLARLARTDPIKAEAYRGQLDDEILPLRTAWQEMFAQCEANREARNREARKHNAAIEAKIAALLVRREEVREPFIRQAYALDGQRNFADRAAAVACAGIGRDYDPDQPTVAGILAVPVHDPAKIRCDLNLPNPDTDESLIPPPWLQWLLTGAMAVCSGIGVGAAAGVVQPARIAEDPLPAILSLIPGSVIAIAVRYVSGYATYVLGERGARGASWQERVPIAVLALVTNTTVVALDTVLGASGLYARERASSEIKASLNGTPSPTGYPLQVLLIAGAVTLSYVAMNSWIGYFRGRASVNRDRIHKAREVRRLAEKDALVQTPAANEAAEAVAGAAVLFSQAQQLHRRGDAAVARLNQEITYLKGLIVPVESRLSQYERYLVEDRYHDWVAAVDDFTEQLRAELAIVALVSPWQWLCRLWSRLWGRDCDGWC